MTFALKPNPILAEQQGFDPATEVEQASASLLSVLQGLATAGIWFGIVWLPILLTLALLGARRRVGLPALPAGRGHGDAADASTDRGRLTVSSSATSYGVTRVLSRIGRA